VSLLVFIILIGFPTVGALAAWTAALRSSERPPAEIPPIPDVRKPRTRMFPVLLLPGTLILLGLAGALVVLGETTPDAVALPAALAYGVPGLLTGVGMAIIYRQGLPPANAPRQAFGRFLTLALIPETSAVFGLVISMLVLGGGRSVGATAGETTRAWLASTFTMVGGFGAPLGAWLATSALDLTTATAFTTTLTRSTWGSTLSWVCIVLAMAALGEWLVVILMVVYFGALAALGLALFMRGRRKRLLGVKGT